MQTYGEIFSGKPSTTRLTCVRNDKPCCRDTARRVREVREYSISLRNCVARPSWQRGTVDMFAFVIHNPHYARPVAANIDCGKKLLHSFEGTLRMSNVCDNGNFSFPKECRQVLSHSDGGEQSIHFRKAGDFFTSLTLAPSGVDRWFKKTNSAQVSY